MDRNPDAPSERAEIRRILATNIRALDERVQTTRAADMSAADEQLQLKRLRTLAQLARQYRLLARDADVDEMESELGLLKEAMTHTEEPR
jgi:hypothetical protein